jgi:CDP-6-deoxy-D-xylo-4-hexulose-3-dehydrase
MFPFADATGAKDRPAVVLSNPDERGDIDVVMITSKDQAQGSMEIRSGDYLGCSLPRQAYARVSRPLRIHQSKVLPLRVSVTPEFTARLRKQIIQNDVRAFSALAHRANRPGDDPSRTPFVPGQTIPYAGRVFTEDEVEAAVSSTLDFWLTLGPQGAAFEGELAALLGVKHSLLVNSGSSANLVAISALTTHKLPAHKRLRPGDEVITVAAGFPTTVAPILQVGAVPVFIDAHPLTGNADGAQLEAAYAPGKTKAVMMAHALGNPFDLATVLAFCKKHDLWLIEDNCDALGCTYTLPVNLAKQLGLDHLIKIAAKGTHPIIRIHGENSGQKSEVRSQKSERTNSQLYLTAPTGSFGDLSTQSFYPPHHLTMGEGGAVNIIRKPALKTYAESFRDWGRDCWCPSGQDNTCAKRFQWQLGELPDGYDHKYIYSHLGYNLKPLDPQAAIGRVQLQKLPAFIAARKQNWERLRRGLHGLETYIDFALPTHAIAWLAPMEEKLKLENGTSASESQLSAFPISAFSWDSSGGRSDCSWFGFMMTLKENAPFTRTELAQELDRNKIGNRMLFGGNLVRQPAFVQLKRDNPAAFRVVSPLSGADRIMNQTIFLGTYPGLSQDQIAFIIRVIRDFVAMKAKLI